MKKKILIFLFVVVAPKISFAKDIIPCDGVTVKCDFDKFLALINNVIGFVLFNLAMPIAAIMFAYAGIKLVTSGGSTEARSSAKSIFTNTAIGFIVAVLAFLIVKTILAILGFKGDWLGF
ncbi:MAG: hypothetical protein AAB500_02010 [Patescibacteria group bacterium]